MTNGLENEDANAQVGALMARLQQLAAVTNACILIIHHPPKNGSGLRGAGAFTGSARVILEINERGRLQHTTNGNNLGRPMEPVAVRMEPVEGIRKVEGQADEPVAVFTTDTETTNTTHPTRERILQLVDDLGGRFSPGVARSVIVANAESATPTIPKSTVDRWLGTLQNSGLLVRRGQGQYVLTDDALELLDDL
jgi:DNA-binding transcriptional ArsR family regulator